MIILPIINPEKEKERIITLIKQTVAKSGIKNVIIGMSGGIDSAISFSLLRQGIPPQNIFPAHLYYFESSIEKNIKTLLETTSIPSENIYNLSIKNSVDELKKDLRLNNENEKDYRLRLGNIMARTRMIMLYDLAKKHNALVLGTENKSEYLLGYFTRFGDEASDIEPIQHLYKTQIYQLAEHLRIPEAIIKQKPTAGLWSGQTDEGEFGFSYEDADKILYCYFDKKLSEEEITEKGLRKTTVEKVLQFAKKNNFKHHLPFAVNF